jgi:myosin heavy subunit
MTNRVTGPGGRGDVPPRTDDARLLALHNLVDELRQALRELAGRQVRLEEMIRQDDATEIQNRLQIEQVRQDVQQSNAARMLDENRTRQTITEIDGRVDDFTRTLRALQSHVNELLEASRRKVDDSALTTRRFEEMRAQVEDVRSIADRAIVLTYEMREGHAAGREEADELRRDLMRVEDQIKMLDQDMRRRVADVQSGTDGFNLRLDEIRSDLAHAFELVEQQRRVLVPMEPAIDELREKDALLRQDITRYAAQTSERIEAVIERQETMGADLESRVVDLRQIQEQRMDRVNERIGELEEQQRNVTYRASGLANELEGLRQSEDALRREMLTLHEQRVRLRMEQVQQELDYLARVRREGEGEPAAPASPGRPRRPDF